MPAPLTNQGVKGDVEKRDKIERKMVSDVAKIEDGYRLPQL
jgi:hypothetical protein